MCIYGYCRISTAKQKIDRQIKNILEFEPKAKIIQEVYTGTKFQGRQELDKLLKSIKPGDTIIFDEVSRISRNADEGIELYLKLFDDGINLIFLKEPHINTATYKQALNSGVPLTNTDIDDILQGINTYITKLATKQIKLAFCTAQREVDYLHQRTSEGLERAKNKGKRVGAQKGDTWQTKKSIAAKAQIKQHSKTYGGSLNDTECMKLTGLSRNTYYKYKKELTAELQATI